MSESPELSLHPLGSQPMPSVGRPRHAQEQPAATQQAAAEAVVGTRPWLTVGVQVVVDVAVLVGVAALAVTGRYLFRQDFDPHTYWQLWPLVSLFAIAYAFAGLYAGTLLSPSAALAPVEELRRAALATSGVCLTLALVIFLARGGLIYSRSILLVFWVLGLVFIPVARAGVRRLCGRRQWWGCPVVVLGAGKTGQLLVSLLQRHPWLGLRPVAFFDEDTRKSGTLQELPVFTDFEMLPAFARKHRISYAVVAMAGISEERLREVNRRYGALFAHLMIIPPLVGFTSLRVEAKDLGGMMGLEVRQRLVLPSCQTAKRLVDFVLTVVGGIVALPLAAVIAALIKLTSRGPVFYRQERIGRGGRRFPLLKFRTMVDGAEAALSSFIDCDARLREQWEREHKLKEDPRVTGVGRWLRRSSLDELPQLWNVLKGDMSLVGPRPIVTAEIPRYGQEFEVYCRVLPGLTGLWQVSGRNETTYPERVRLDTYYVANWSVWLDVYILARSIGVILHGRGAC